MRKIRNFWPLFFIGFIVLIISFRNYIPGTWLTGWDNLNPEFNFPLNIRRSIFSVWQEYQGLGSIGGLAYGSDLIRQIILRILSFVLSTSLLRYIYTFTMALLGPLGVYVLLEKIIFKDVENSIIKVGSFLGAVFYLLNLATVQIFFTPFESFTAFYGFLPWCIFSFLYYLKDPDKKQFLIFFIINILAMTQFYVPTIFIVFIISLILILIGYFLEKRKVSVLKISSKLFLTLFFINAFWLLPFLYFTFTHINQPVDSHMNMMSTEDIYLRNKQYGDLADVILLKGFAFNYVDKDASGNYSYLMSNWREHIDKPYVKLIGFGVFLIIILGLFHAHKKQKQYRWSFTLLFIFSFMMLANDTPFFSFIVEFLRTRSSLFAQIFRVSFTKFGNLALFSYSIFFAFGMLAVISYFNRLVNSRNKLDKFFIAIIIFCLGIYALPVFEGELFYYKTRIKIPDEYFSLMDYFNKQVSAGRISLLPQFSYWGWNYYKWGYGGSGFLWYGIKNPTQDRAFDGYRKENENYYWEISNSLYSGNLPLFENLLEKYQIEWILFDENIIGSVSTRALNFNNIQGIIGQSTKLNLATHFGKLKVYHVNLDATPKNFVFLANNLPVVGPGYKWGNYDKGYEGYGNYITNTKYQKSNIKDEKSEIKDSTRGFFGTFGFSREQSKIEENKSQETHKTIEDEIPLSSVHTFAPFPLAKKYGIENQNNTIRTTPNTSTHKEDLSNPGIVTTNGNIIEPAVNCPAATDTSIKARFWLTFNSSLFCSINNTLEKVYHLVNLTKDLPVVVGYKWGNYDKGYEEYGNYIVDNRQQITYNKDQKLSGRFGGFFGFTAAKQHQDGDSRIQSNYQNDRPESKIVSHKLYFLAKNQHNPQISNVDIKLDNITRTSFLSTNKEANKNAKVTAPAFIPISANSLYSDRENRNIFSEYHENNNIVNQVFAAEGSVSPLEAFSDMFVPDIYYPFRSLFTGRKQEELEFGVEDKKDYFSFKSKIQKELEGYKLKIPPLESKEVTELDTSNLNKTTVKIPKIYLDGEFIPFASSSANTIDLPYIKNGDLEVRVPKINGYYSYNYQPSTTNQQPKTCDQFNKGIYTYDRIKENGQELLRLTSVGSSNCLDFDMPNLTQNIGYFVTLENRNVEGKSLLFSVINKNSQRADIETYLPKFSELTTHNPQLITSYFVIPPMEQFGLGYTLHLDNISIGRVKTVNDLGKVTVNPIPYRFLTSLKIVNLEYSSSEQSESRSSRQARTIIDSSGFSVSHSNPSLYQVIMNNETMKQCNNGQCKNLTLVLSQSFDSGWHAYDIKLKTQNSKLKTALMQIFPFWFGNEIKNHVLVNNWENGWRLQPPTINNQPSTIVIVYLPQYLEYIGLIIFISLSVYTIIDTGFWVLHHKRELAKNKLNEYDRSNRE